MHNLDISASRACLSARDWESTFLRWSTGPSDSEQLRAENAERQVKQAIAASDKLKNRTIRVFTQGSYRNRVNVRKDSDVDVGIICFDTFFPEYPDENVKAHFRNIHTDSVYTYSTFKSEIEEALVARFGRHSVSRGNKSFDIKENTYRVEADVAAFFEHRRYDRSGNYISGVEMIPDDYNPPRVRNWPEQHYENGVFKNNNSARRFKRVVRIIKSLSNEMASKGITSAKEAPSFLIECLVFNVPIHLLCKSTYLETIKAVLVYLFEQTSDANKCSDWGEVSELKYLFRSSQPWTRESANKFILDAWNYIGF
jgi:hypothetical protein